LKALTLVALLVLDLLLLLHCLGSRQAADVWVHPVAPALTRIPDVGDRSLGETFGAGRSASPGSPVGPPPTLARHLPALRRVASLAPDARQQEAMGRAEQAGRSLQAGARTGIEARLALQDDTIELARALGGARVEHFIVHKEALARALGEELAWRDLALALDEVGP
jgi:hypothetical protein